ncbi:pirin family protein [Frankia sp. QA3]|uniref:pirin family protein n=1 Tax=Frankia sp. QA3 TaxID=710111 RepID=UPI000269CA3C|nr:pirin family protein [Frankia sp. QA3]EIV94286.1 Pirin-related protein [Frankia sp. QA3]
MSGPVSPVDVAPGPGDPPVPPPALAPAPDRASVAGPELEVVDGRAADVSGIPVRRVLPRRVRRTIGAWCFVDHMGPTAISPSNPVAVGPHPHIGLATVTWLLHGRQVHRDSLGSEQVLRPGELNLMSAGHGVAHAEESEDHRGELHGVQLWVAQPEHTRHGPPAFAHHADLPVARFGAAEVTVLLGELDGNVSPARTDTPLVGADLALRAGGTVLPLRRDFEHGLVVLAGSVEVGAQVLRPGRLGYLGAGRDELPLRAGEGARVLLLGGEPFADRLVMWWNFVARSRAEIDVARADWQAGADRFGAVATNARRIPAPERPWAAG